MTAAIDLAKPLAVDLEAILIGGDLSKMTPEQRVAYVRAACDSLGLNPLTRPLQLLRLNGRDVLYATRDCTDQLRKRDRIGITITARERHDDVYIVTARATTPDGRTDESVGAVPIAGLKGEALANAFMKAETKSKRRVTLSICGLGLLDESEVESIPGAQHAALAMVGKPAAPAPALAAPPVAHDPDGVVVEPPPAAPSAEAKQDALFAELEKKLLAAAQQASAITVQQLVGAIARAEVAHEIRRGHVVALQSALETAVHRCLDAAADEDTVTRAVEVGRAAARAKLLTREQQHAIAKSKDAALARLTKTMVEAWEARVS